MTTQGTKEWADSNVNIYSGCSNGCLYCYAKGMAIRFKRKTEETWNEMVLNEKSFGKNYKKRKGRVMFPTSHDITLETVDNCLTTIKKLLEAGNQVLITTKPSLQVIHQLCFALENYKDLVQFRFTITTSDFETSKFWEPGAPDPGDRFASLIYANKHGFKTSVSIEPFLGPTISDVARLVDAVHVYCTESVWLGPMNKNFCPSGQWSDLLWGKKALSLLKKMIDMSDFPRVKYKDSYLNELSSKA